MADVKVHNQTTKEKGVERAAARRGEFAPLREMFPVNPFALMRRLSEEMDRAFASSFGISPGLAPTEMGAWSPAIDVTERENHILVTAELPGLNKDDVKIEVTDEGLVIQGEKKRESEERHKGYYRCERSYGEFYRLIPLPEGVEADKAQARFKEGILEVDIPYPEAQRKHREIPIKT